MSRKSYLPFAFALAGLFGVGLAVGCDPAAQDDEAAQRMALLTACGLNDGTVEHDADLRACEPGNTKKTTICHVPPGNPANAHTLCIGNAAVRAHLANHDDYLGPCKRENPCPTTGTGGSTGTGGATQTGTGGSTGTGGDAPATGTGGATGSGGSGGGDGVIVK